MAVQYLHVPLENLTEQTLLIMQQLTWEAKRDPRIKQIAVSALSGAGIKNGRNKPQAARVLSEWVKSHVSFFCDPVRTETLQAPLNTIKVGYGDCDDLSILYASLLMSIGIDARFLVLGRDAPEHVRVESLEGGSIRFDAPDPTAGSHDPAAAALSIFYIADFKGDEYGTEN